MTKSEFIAKFAEKTGVTKVDSEKAVNTFLETVTDTLKTGEKVVFTGFGSFYVTERPEQEGRNPQNGETILIAASKSPKFKAGKTLKDSLA